MQNIPMAFFKPADGKDTLFTVDTAHGDLSIRSVDLNRDISELYHWMTRPYSRRFWQWEGSPEELREYFRAMLESTAQHPFVLEREGQILALVEMYSPRPRDWNQWLEIGPGDAGLHFLMLPPRQSARGLAVTVLQRFIAYFFSLPGAERLLVEPDWENTLANKLARQAGFHFHQTIDLPGKRANLYTLTKAFSNAYPIA